MQRCRRILRAYNHWTHVIIEYLEPGCNLSAKDSLAIAGLPRLKASLQLLLRVAYFLRQHRRLLSDEFHDLLIGIRNKLVEIQLAHAAQLPTFLYPKFCGMPADVYNDEGRLVTEIETDGPPREKHLYRFPLLVCEQHLYLAAGVHRWCSGLPLPPTLALQSLNKLLAPLEPLPHHRVLCARRTVARSCCCACRTSVLAGPV